MESSSLCLQYFIGMGNFPRNCQWMKLVIGNFEKIVFGNLSKDGVAIFVGDQMPELELCKVGSNLLHKRGP
jgi:hypothetical protein